MPQITREQLAVMFPRASRSTIEANAVMQNNSHICIPPPAPSAKPKQGAASRCNKTEADFALILEAQKRGGEIVSYQFEGITLRLADNCRYTPDFFIIVALEPLRIRFCETKGAHIWDDSKVKFRVAKEQNQWAQWEMWQRKKSAWNRLL